MKKMQQQQQEDNTLHIARQIYGGQPRPPSSYQLQLEGVVAQGASQAIANCTIAEVLIIVFLEGIRVLFGDQMTNPAMLTDDQLALVRRYVQSYGYEMVVTSGNLVDAPDVSDVPRQNLIDFFERFYNFDEMIWKQFSFRVL